MKIKVIFLWTTLLLSLAVMGFTLVYAAPPIVYLPAHSGNYPCDIGTNGSTSGVFPVTIATTAGERIIVSADRLDGANFNGVVTVSDTASNVYTNHIAIASTTSLRNVYTYVWSTISSTTTGSLTITATFDGAGFRRGCIIADSFSGVASINNPQFASIDNAYGNQFLSNTLTFSGVKLNAWLYDVFAMQNGPDCDPATIGAGQVIAQQDCNHAATAFQETTTYKSVTTATDSMSGTMSINDGDNWNHVGIELNPSVDPPPTPSGQASAIIGVLMILLIVGLAVSLYEQPDLNIGIIKTAIGAIVVLGIIFMVFLAVGL